MPRLKKKQAQSTPIKTLIEKFEKRKEEAKDLRTMVFIDLVLAELDTMLQIERTVIEDAHVEGQIHTIDIIAKSLGKEMFKPVYDEIQAHKDGDRDENAIKFFDDKYVK
jgi:hypothetical protein